MKKDFEKYERKGLPGGPNETFSYITGVFDSGSMMQGAYRASSSIDGEGMFAGKAFKRGDLIGLAHEDGQPASELGRMHNHSENDATMVSNKVGNQRFVYAARDIQPGEELTTNYRLQPELEQPEDFMMPMAQQGGDIPMLDPNRSISSQADEYTEPSERDRIAVRGTINDANSFPTPDLGTVLREIQSGLLFTQREEDQREFDEALNFAANYMSSPRYREMLSNSGGTRDYHNEYDIAKARINNLNSLQEDVKYSQDTYQAKLGLINPDNSGGFYHPSSNSIYVNKNTIDNQPGVFDHELSHLIDFMGVAIPDKDADLIKSLVDDTIPIEYIPDFMKSSPLALFGYEDGYRKYLTSPTETRARLNDIRRRLYDKGVDIFNNKVTPEDYDKLDPNEQPVYELRQVFPNESILKMLNEISMDDSQEAGLPLAEYGGDRTTALRNFMYDKKRNKPFAQNGKEVDASKTKYVGETDQGGYRVGVDVDRGDRQRSRSFSLEPSGDASYNRSVTTPKGSRSKSIDIVDGEGTKTITRTRNGEITERTKTLGEKRAEKLRNKYERRVNRVFTDPFPEVPNPNEGKYMLDFEFQMGGDTKASQDFLRNWYQNRVLFSPNAELTPEMRQALMDRVNIGPQENIYDLPAAQSGAELDTDRLRKGISYVESKDGLYMMNPESTATGLYGQRFSELENQSDLYSGTREEFAKDLDAQDKIFDLRISGGIPGTPGLEQSAYDLTDEYSTQLGNDFDYTADETAALINFLGRQGTRVYFGNVLRDGMSLQEALPNLYSGDAKQSNKTPEEYIEEYREAVKKQGGENILGLRYGGATNKELSNYYSSLLRDI